MSLLINVNDPDRPRYGLLETFTTAEKDTSKVLKPDGENGVEWGVDGSGSGSWFGTALFSKSGSLNNTTVLKVRSGDTFNSGKYYGTTNEFSLIGIRYNITSSAASGAGDFIIEVRHESTEGNTEHSLGGGDLLKQQTIITSLGVEAIKTRIGGEIPITPIPLIQDRVYYVDVASIGDWALTDVEIALILS